MKTENADRIALARRQVMRGDYLEARRLIQGAEGDPELTESERDQLRAVRSLVRPDPAALVVFGLTLALLLFLVVRFVL